MLTSLFDSALIQRHLFSSAVSLSQEDDIGEGEA
jgi:hypothetical protein